MKRLALLCLIAACQPIPGPVPMPPSQEGDASTSPPPDAPSPDLPSGCSTCACSCAVLLWLGCDEGLPTPRGEPCAETCQHAVDYPGFRLPTAQIARCRDIECVRRSGVACR